MTPVRSLVMTALLLLGLTGCTPGTPAVRLRVTGAQIATELVESWLNAFVEPRFVIERAANPVWSQTGFDALAKGTCDVACTDRPITQRELKTFGEREVRGYRVAFYGFALYVNAENPVDSIFANHIGPLFQRKILDWTELAGNQLPDCTGPITLYGPKKATRGGMVLMQQAKIWFAAPTWQALDSDQEIVKRVAADPQAIGFASIGYDGEGTRYLGIRMQRHGPPALPSLEEIEAEKYGLAKVIYVYFAAPCPGGDAVVEYLFGPAGRRAIERTSVWPLDRARAAVNPTP